MTRLVLEGSRTRAGGGGWTRRREHLLSLAELNGQSRAAGPPSLPCPPVPPFKARAHKKVPYTTLVRYKREYDRESVYQKVGGRGDLRLMPSLGRRSLSCPKPLPLLALPLLLFTTPSRTPLKVLLYQQPIRTTPELSDSDARSIPSLLVPRQRLWPHPHPTRLQRCPQPLSVLSLPSSSRLLRPTTLGIPF